jgi:hypothetical protein
MRYFGAVALLSLLLASPAMANDGCGKPTGWCDVNCCVSSVCRPVCKVVPNEKTCYEVVCKQICIPAIRFPWDKCCTPKCGKVRTVHRLATRTYQCGEKVVWEWNIEADCPQAGTYDSCGATKPASAYDTLAPAPSAPAAE